MTFYNNGKNRNNRIRHNSMKRYLITTAYLFISCIALQAQNDVWTNLGMVKFPQNPSVQTTGMGRVSHLAFHPTDSNILFAASASGGLWKSSNDGKTWKPLTDNLPNTACASVCLNFKNANTIYLGTGDANYYGGGMGVWKSTDGGATWSQMNNGMGNVLVVQMAMHSKDTNTIVATTNAGIYKTTNGGNLWVKKSSATDQYNDLVVKPGSNLGLYATSFQYFYSSMNFGESWNRINMSPADTFSGIYIGVTPADTNLVYCATWRSKSWGTKTYFGGVFKSQNGGQNWKLQSNKPQILGYSSDGSSNDGQGAYNLTITVDPKDPASVYVAGICIWKSRDSGITWKLKSPWAFGVHADKHHYIFSPHNAQKLYLTHDGGMDRSLDTGNTWKTITDGLTASEFYKMGQSSLNREKALGGLQDNGLNYYKNGIFYTIRGGDYSGEFLFDYQDTNSQYFQGGGNKYNLNNLGSYSINGQANSVYELHRKDTNLMYMAYHMLYRTTNLKSGTVAWTQLSDSLLHNGKASTTAMANCKPNPNFLYWARNNGVLYRVDNVNSVSPTFVVLTKPMGTIQQIHTHAKDSNVVYITIGSKIYKSSDKGNTWWDFTKNLPGNYLVAFQIDDRATDSGVYVATNFGVFYKNKSLTKWITVSKNLPAIAGITDMEIFNDGTPQSCLRISTYGRGLWQTTLYQYQIKKPTSDFFVNSTSSSSCAKNFILNDLSGGGKYTRVWNIIPYTGYKYTNNTDSISRLPEILFSTSGNYTITLTVTNSYGSSSKTKIVVVSDIGKPSTCTVNSNNLGNYSIGIYRFEMAGIDRRSAYSLYNNPNVEDYSCSDVAFVKPGNSYTAWITNGNSYNEVGAIYIDYNNDGDFLDANELATTFASGKGRRSAIVKIPTSSTVFNTFLRMRIISDWTTIAGACGNLAYGQAEDYALYIDNRRPVVTLNLPKPKVYGKFNATLKLSEYTPSFDTSKLKFTNAKITSIVKLNPQWYDLVLSPNKPGKIYANITASSLTDPVGNVNSALADSTLFEMGLYSFTFPGHSKRDSIVQNDTGGIVYCSVYNGTIADSLVANFSLTDSTKAFVKNQIQVNNFTKNNYTNPLLFLVKNNDGSYVKKYSIQLIYLPDTACELLTFEFSNPASIGAIAKNPTGGIVNLKVPYKTNLKSRVAHTTISKNAKTMVNNALEISGTSLHNFENSVEYIVIAEDTNYRKTYTINIEVLKNMACNLLSWNLLNPAANGIISNQDTMGGIVTASVPFGTNKTTLVANFILSDSANMTIGGIKQKTNISFQNYLDTVKVVVTSQDGLHFKTYKIIVKTIPNSACEMFSYQIKSPSVVGSFTRDTTGGKIAISVPENTDITQLVGVFTVSDSALTKIQNITQYSGTTVNDFTSLKEYKVFSQNGMQFKTYRLTVTKILGWHDPSISEFNMYPNPASAYLHFATSQNNRNFNLHFYNAMGQKVLEFTNNLNPDISALSQGVYEIWIEYNGNREIKKLVKY